MISVKVDENLIMSRRSSETSSLEDLPVYFKPFTRESLKAIKERKEEEQIRLAEEKLQKKEVCL